VFRRDQSDCPGFWSDSKHFVKAARNGGIEWGFEGKHGDDIRRGITVDDVRWLLPYLLRITPEHLRAGLKASGATERQSACWAAGIESRISQLREVAR
jgi:hypothetical protein